MGSNQYATQQNVAQSSQQHVPPAVVPQPPQVQQQPVGVKSNEEGLAEHAERLRKFQRLGNSMIQMGPPRLDNNTTSSLQPQPWIQRKLTIGELGDKYEQEADRVASQVVQHINAPTFKENNLRQSIQCEKDLEGVMYAKGFQAAIQRKQAIADGEATPNFESAINSARGSGQPLDAGLKQLMGQAMGADFSGVRVHTDSQSDQLNKSIQARAFTTGQDVFFREGAYQPGNRGGQELIAHELTHVVQQNGGDQNQGRGLDISGYKCVEQEEDVMDQTASGQLSPQKQPDSLQKQVTPAISAQDFLQRTLTNCSVIQRAIRVHRYGDINAEQAIELIRPYLNGINVDVLKVQAALSEMDRIGWMVYSAQNLAYDALRLASFLVKLKGQSVTYYFDTDKQTLLGNKVPAETLISEFSQLIKFRNRNSYFSPINFADNQLKKDFDELRQMEGFDQILQDATSLSSLHIERAKPGRGAHFSPGENFNTVRVRPPGEIWSNEKRDEGEDRNDLMFEIINAAHKLYFDLALARLERASEGRESPERTNAVYAIDCERVELATAMRQFNIYVANGKKSDWLAYFFTKKIKFDSWLASQVREGHTTRYDPKATPKNKNWIGYEIVKEDWADGTRSIPVNEPSIEQILRTVGQGPIEPI